MFHFTIWLHDDDLNLGLKWVKSLILYRGNISRVYLRNSPKVSQMAVSSITTLEEN